MGDEGRERNDRPWFKVSTSILDSDDLNDLSPAHERVWWRLLALCAKRGYGDMIRGTPADIADKMPGITERALRSALNALEKPGSEGEALIEVGYNHVRIVKWNAYQPVSTSAERMREKRQRDKTVTSRRRHGDVTRDRLEEEGEEERRITHTPSPVRETAPPVPPPPVCVGKPPAPNPNGFAATDADLMPFFNAYNAGVYGPNRDRWLKWKQAYFYATEQIHAHGKPVERVVVVAAFYRARMKDGTANISRFAAEIDKWDCECSAAVAPAGGKATPKTAAEWLREGRCPKHPAEPTDCEVCRGFEEYKARHTVPA